MTISVRVDVTGVAEVTRTLTAMSPAKRPAFLRKFLIQAAEGTLNLARTKHIRRGGGLKGGGELPALPNKLTSRTGTLRRSLSSSRGIDRRGLPRFIEFGTDLVYGRAHELGFRGTVSVPTHTRRNPGGQGSHSVRGHQRRMNLPRRPFLEPAVNDAFPKLGPLALRLWREQVERA